MAHEDSSGWQHYARRQADRLEEEMLAGQSLEEQRQSIVASFYDDYLGDLEKERQALIAEWEKTTVGPDEEPSDDAVLAAEFFALVASFEADHGEALAETLHIDRYVVAPQRHGRGTLVASYVTDSLPEDLDGLLAALHERDNAPGGLVAACAAGEHVEPWRQPGSPRDHMPRGSASGAALVASMAPAGYQPQNGPVARARRRDRLERLLARDRPRGTGSPSVSRASSITAAAAYADSPDGHVLTWSSDLNREVRKRRLAELLDRQAAPA